MGHFCRQRHCALTPRRAESVCLYLLDIRPVVRGMPDEVATIAVLLACDEATYVTGTEVNIDGGLLAASAASPG